MILLHLATMDPFSIDVVTCQVPFDDKWDDFGTKGFEDIVDRSVAERHAHQFKINQSRNQNDGEIRAFQSKLTNQRQ